MAQKKTNFIFATKIVIPKSLKFMNSGSEFYCGMIANTISGLNKVGKDVGCSICLSLNDGEFVPCGDSRLVCCFWVTEPRAEGHTVMGQKPKPVPPVNIRFNPTTNGIPLVWTQSHLFPKEVLK